MTTTLARPLWIVIIAADFHLCAVKFAKVFFLGLVGFVGFGGAARAFFTKRK